jgi:hypothetical protein
MLSSISRKDRCQELRKKIDNDWSQYWFDYIMKNVNPENIDWFLISSNPNLNINIINSAPPEKWDRSHVSRNPGITLNDITNNPGFKWVWSYISQNPNLTFEFIIKNKDMFSVEYRCVFNNPGITMQEFTDNKEFFINNRQLFTNKFSKDAIKFKIQHYRRHMAAFRIQQHWHRIRLDPRHPVGLRRLEWEYDALAESLSGFKS